MGGFSNFAISFSIISILTGAVTLYEHGLVMGGPAEMAFGWPLVSIFALAVALSMAELASALPTSGTMYHWSSRLGGKAWGWFTGGSYRGQLSALAAIDTAAHCSSPRCSGCRRRRPGCSPSTQPSCVTRAHQPFRDPVSQAQRLSVTVHVVGVIVIVGRCCCCAQTAGEFLLCPHHLESRWLAVLVGVRRRLLQAQWTLPATTHPRACQKSAGSAPQRAVGYRHGRGGLERGRVSAVIALTLAIKDIPSVLNAVDARGNDVPP